MTISGKIVFATPIQVGKRQDGSDWARKGYVLEEIGLPYPQRLFFNVFGTDDMMYFNLKVGDIVRVRYEMSVIRTDSGFLNVATAYNIIKIPLEKLGYKESDKRPVVHSKPKVEETKKRTASKKKVINNNNKPKRKRKEKFDINSLPF